MKRIGPRYNSIEVEHSDLTFDPAYSHTRGRLDNQLSGVKNAHVAITDKEVIVNIADSWIHVPFALIDALRSIE